MNHDSGLCRLACTDVSGDVQEFMVWLPLAVNGDVAYSPAVTAQTIEPVENMDVSDGAEDTDDDEKPSDEVVGKEGYDDVDLEAMRSLFD